MHQLVRLILSVSLFCLAANGQKAFAAEDQPLSQNEVTPSENTPTETSEYQDPNFTYIFTSIPNTAWNFLKRSFSADAVLPWVGIISSTALLMTYDAEILSEVQKEGRDLGLGNKDKTKPFVSIGKHHIVRLPTDLGSAMYFLGDGWTHLGIATSFGLVGYFTDDLRALNTSYQIVSGVLGGSLFNQLLKRTLGREGPKSKTSPTGTWHFFPNPLEYAKHTTSYDAMPSGHMMTASLVLTIVNTNYPEYSHVILPAGITLLTMLGWQMVNNSEHWMSDYPLAIAMGITYAKAVTDEWKFKKNIASEKLTYQRTMQISPMLHPNAIGLNFDFVL